MKSKSYILFSFLFIYINYNFQNNENNNLLLFDKILESNDIEIWDLITEDIVLSEKFKSNCQNQNPQSEQEWIDALNKLNLWDITLKKIILKRILKSKLSKHMGDIFKNQNLNYGLIRKITKLDFNVSKNRIKEEKLLLKELILARSMLLLHKANLITLKSEHINKLQYKENKLFIIIKNLNL